MPSADTRLLKFAPSFFSRALSALLSSSDQVKDFPVLLLLMIFATLFLPLALETLVCLTSDFDTLRDFSSYEGIPSSVSPVVTF